jgi:hypothetical protein
MSNLIGQRRCHISEMTMDELREQARLAHYLCPITFNEAEFWENALSPPSKNPSTSAQEGEG